MNIIALSGAFLGDGLVSYGLLASGLGYEQDPGQVVLRDALLNDVDLTAMALWQLDLTDRALYTVETGNIETAGVYVSNEPTDAVVLTDALLADVVATDGPPDDDDSQ